MEEWRIRSEKITQVVSDMPRGGKSLKVDDIIAEMMDILDKTKKKVSESDKIKLELEIAIMGLGDGVLESLMRYRYINCLEWARIAIIMGYGERHLYKLHGKALYKLEI
ncbi:MAG: DUF1492 domain-containing protein [Eubacterium sp.]